MAQSIKKLFAYHKPSPESLDRITKLRQAYTQLHDAIEENMPSNSREKSLAITNLEVSAMWAVKAVVLNDPNSEAETS